MAEQRRYLSFAVCRQDGGDSHCGLAVPTLTVTHARIARKGIILAIELGSALSCPQTVGRGPEAACACRPVHLLNSGSWITRGQQSLRSMRGGPSRGEASLAGQRVRWSSRHSACQHGGRRWVVTLGSRAKHQRRRSVSRLIWSIRRPKRAAVKSPPPPCPRPMSPLPAARGIRGEDSRRRPRMSSPSSAWSRHAASASAHCGGWAGGGMRWGCWRRRRHAARGSGECRAGARRPPTSE